MSFLLCGVIGVPFLSAQVDYYPPPESRGGWRSLVTANSVPNASEKESILRTTALDWDRLAEAWSYCQSFQGPDSLLVIRNGWIAAEWHNYSNPRGIASCTKSLTSLVMAKVFDLSDAGRLSKPIRPEDYAYRYLPAWWSSTDRRKRQIRIRHLLTMTSGLEPYDGPDKDLQAYAKIVLSTPMESPPGTVWAYASVPVDLLSLIVENVTRAAMRDLFDREIGAPIGVQSGAWPEFDGHTGGSGGPGGGARFATRDLARVGYLMLREGKWNDGSGARQIVSRDRVAIISQPAAFLKSARYRTPNFARERNAHRYYGWLWWTNRTGETLGTEVPRDAFYMSGWGKQACWVIPSLDMVAVRLGPNKVLNEHPEYYRELWRRLTAAIAPKSRLSFPPAPRQP